jgi:hypothetical protein
MNSESLEIESREMVEIDRLLQDLHLDQSTYNQLMTAVCDFGTAEHIRGQRMAGAAITAIIQGDLLVFDDRNDGVLSFEYPGIGL